MICRPFFGDQGVAGRLIEDVWEIGVVMEGKNRKVIKDPTSYNVNIRGIKSADTATDIKKAYHKAALRHHADKLLARSEVGDEGQLWKEISQEVYKDADKLFKMIGEAYTVLSDPAQEDLDWFLTDRWAGQALFGTLTPDIIVLTLLYSIAGLGIAIVNDFKSVEGDRALGLQSLPVAFGAETAKWICVGAIDITQLSVAGYLLGADKPFYALALLSLIIPQVFFQFKYFRKDSVKYDVKYQASAQPFLVLGLLVTALATSH
ncbi:hypothetical protein JHK82_044585 [Glycine max]|nr:hypothetical protein JHK82_044585 [Glycine max]